MLFKECIDCGHSSPATPVFFQRHPQGRDGIRALCRKCGSLRAQARHLANPRKRRTYRLRRYGITVDDYESLLARQGGTCATCSNRPGDVGKGGTLHVDHDHVTGVVRGLLCHPCNTTLGHVKDSPETLQRLSAYVERVGF